MTEQELKDDYKKSSILIEKNIKLFKESIDELNKIKKELAKGITLLNNINKDNTEDYQIKLNRFNKEKEIYWNFFEYSLKGTRYNGHLKRAIHNFEDYLREFRNNL